MCRYCLWIQAAKVAGQKEETYKTKGLEYRHLSTQWQTANRHKTPEKEHEPARTVHVKITLAPHAASAVIDHGIDEQIPQPRLMRPRCDFEQSEHHRQSCYKDVGHTARSFAREANGKEEADHPWSLNAKLPGTMKGYGSASWEVSKTWKGWWLQDMIGGYSGQYIWDDHNPVWFPSIPALDVTSHLLCRPLCHRNRSANFNQTKSIPSPKILTFQSEWIPYGSHGFGLSLVVLYGGAKGYVADPWWYQHALRGQREYIYRQAADGSGRASK